MDFLKKHYEKVLMGVVLLGLMVAVVMLPFIINSKRASLAAMEVNFTPKPKPLTNLDMTVETDALQRVQSPVNLDFTTNHNLFNPVLWQKLPDGHVVKVTTGNETGVGALEITDIKPLYLTITYDSPNANGYFIFIEDQSAEEASKRAKHEAFMVKGEKKDFLTLKEVKGPPEKPTELVLELNDSGENISVTPEKPFRRVEGYQADLKYGLDKKIWKNQRVKSVLNFAGGQYIIVAINENNVVLSAKSNDKKTTITFNPANEPPPR